MYRELNILGLALLQSITNFSFPQTQTLLKYLGNVRETVSAVAAFFSYTHIHVCMHVSFLIVSRIFRLPNVSVRTFHSFVLTHIFSFHHCPPAFKKNLLCSSDDRSPYPVPAPRKQYTFVFAWMSSPPISPALGGGRCVCVCAMTLPRCILSSGILL